MRNLPETISPPKATTETIAYAITPRPDSLLAIIEAQARKFNITLEFIDLLSGRDKDTDDIPADLPESPVWNDLLQSNAVIWQPSPRCPEDLFQLLARNEYKGGRILLNTFALPGENKFLPYAKIEIDGAEPHRALTIANILYHAE
ncbi:MAG: hypothetical protein UT55_C0008G0005 [Candidatus Peregrinibacteria bacterium GW2011_GWE2_39_6]|nr:MAG: hypothetical protein UT36_C0002G0061 [Candidatus Peregrinibacteria bacterium GW2011_GWF2_39_17]KKR26414.1 MAG: hypothetical protein UT55_C0008G0005 [Candidatus Peregrinibacteria bacterium GW2011_GWE2_39_6]HCW32165.1 hypothetical protein [Candidatus Peregrinibacteria bacterium]